MPALAMVSRAGEMLDGTLTVCPLDTVTVSVVCVGAIVAAAQLHPPLADTSQVLTESHEPLTMLLKIYVVRTVIDAVAWY
jgi:hypothetical protein